MLVFGQALLLELVHDGFRPSIGDHPMPRLPQEVQVGVIDILAEWWVGEDVVNRAIWDIKL
jgi:hypothetical protein